jgi:cytidyltransferase-like protein
MATPKTCVSQFVPTSRRIVQFSNRKDPEPSDTIVYVDGAFDLFHVGHVQFLEQARKLGSYVICGVLPDEMLNKWMGANYPIMNVYERTLSVLSCRFVDEVIIGAPEITEQFLKDYNIASSSTAPPTSLSSTRTSRRPTGSPPPSASASSKRFRAPRRSPPARSSSAFSSIAPSSSSVSRPSLLAKHHQCRQSETQHQQLSLSLSCSRRCQLRNFSLELFVATARLGKLARQLDKQTLFVDELLVR